MNKRLIFFRGAYDTLDLFTTELMREFEQSDFECLAIDAGDMKQGMNQLLKFMDPHPDAVVTFNNLGFNLELSEGVNAWDALQIPCINILMDHPFRYRKALEHAPENGIVLCPDRNHVKYIRRFYPNIKCVDFLPHAGIEAKLDMTQAGRSHPAIKERPIEVLYAGGLAKYAAAGLVPDLGAITEFDAFALTQEVLAELIKHPTQTTEMAIESYLQTLPLEYTDEQLHDWICRLRFIDVFAVSFYRELAVKNLVEAGIKVRVYGAGWEQCEWSCHPNLDYRGQISVGDVLLEMNQSKIVLNTMTWFKDGTHDRVFNGMLAGAGVVSDSSIYMKEHFTEHELYMYELTDTPQLPAVVSKLLSDETALQNMADCGYQAALAEHTWKNRAEEICSYLKKMISL